MRQTKALRQPHAVFDSARGRFKRRSPSRELQGEKRRKASLGSAPSFCGRQES